MPYTPRATTMAELHALQSRLLTREEIAKGLAFRPRPTDVIIAPFGKSGTTWLQQIFHTLRTRGDTDFDDISDVVPWIETAAALGQDLEADQKANPRGFKSHLGWDAVPKGGRYIVSIRDPKDALVSAYRFMEGWFIAPGTVSIADFARAGYLGGPEGRSYWAHLASWWQVRHDPAVLLLSYEQMHRDPEGTIRRVARHCGIALDDELLAITRRHSSLEFMLAHKNKFDDLRMRMLSEARCGLPPGSDSAKVRLGRVGSHRDELPDEIRAAMDARWKEQITARFGYPDYAALEAALTQGR
ncbi:MAG TPA: sulfotransferase domain-containing protein [Pseudomonadales bacterium]